MTNSSANDEKKVLQAIQALGYRVTIADVVARTGLSIDAVSRILASIAARSASSLQVCQDGLVRYCFSSHLIYQFWGKGFRRFLASGMAFTGKYLSYLFKISFGLILLFSVVSIFGLAVIFRTIFLAAANDYDGIRREWGEFFSLFKLLAGEPANSIEENGKERAFSVDRLNIVPFLMNCYKFLFGPGNPNKDFDVERLQLIAQTIRLNEGIVLPEQLYPYMGTQMDTRLNSDGDGKNDFEILHKFGGHPIVLEDSQIAYVFPEMSVRSDVDSYAHVKALLEEEEWQVTELSWKQTSPVLMLAFMSICGTFICVILTLLVKGSQLHHLNMLTFFATYSCLFLFIPAVRFFLVRWLNRGVRLRNSARRRYESQIGEPDAQLRCSLEDVERLRRENRILRSDQVVYRTDRDYLEQLTDG